MTQRHEHDTIERLWPGAADPSSLLFVPLELRDAVAGIPDAAEKKLRRELHATRGEVTVTAGRTVHTLNPATDDADFETCLVVMKNKWARQQLDSERAVSEQAARDAAAYTCRCCGELAVPDGTSDRHTRRRRFTDGSHATVCDKCAAVAERLAVDRLAADRLDGISRADRARKLLEAQP